MSRYSSSTVNSYDPVDNQQQQPNEYTYAILTTTVTDCPSTAASSYLTNTRSYQNCGRTYKQQQYGQGAQQATGTVATPSSMNNYSTTTNTGYDSTAWQTADYNGYDNVSLPSQASSSTFGRLSIPDHTQNSSGSQSYQTAPSQAQNLQPSRFNSPLNAVHAQQRSRSAQSSRTSITQHQPSRQLQNVPNTCNRQLSDSPAPPRMTANPSQVYDDRAECQQMAQLEAERHRKCAEEQAARKLEGERIAEEKRREEEARAKIEREIEAKKAVCERKADVWEKAMEERRQSKGAAATLKRKVSSLAVASSSTTAPMDGSRDKTPTANDEEAEMRAMFKKMREYNSKNPALLAKLLEEERLSHAVSHSSSALNAAGANETAPASSTSNLPTPSDVFSVTPVNGHYRPFQKPSKQKSIPPPKSVGTVTANAGPKPAQSATAIIPPTDTPLWPPQKKGTLSEVAAKWLSNLPQNAKKTVTKEDILKILERNPSHVQFCEALEKQGLRFERSLLARELLKADPDGTKTSVQQQTSPTPLSTVNRTSAQINASPDPVRRKDGKAPTVSCDVPSYSTLSAAARAVNDMGRQSSNLTSLPDTPRPHIAPSTATGNATTSSVEKPMPGTRVPSMPLPLPPQVQAAMKSEGKLEQPPRPPANKEEAARKRTFSDLVDLTADNSDDDRPPNKLVFLYPFPNAAEGRPGVSLPLQPPFTAAFRQPIEAENFYNPRRIPGPDTASSATWYPVGSQNLVSAPLPRQPAPSITNKSKGPSLEQKQMERIRGKMLVEPIMKDRVARRNKYDSRTIARDVLLATGRHPDMRALNAHLNSMARLLGDHGGSFEVDGVRGNRADLSTIQWDIIDPGKPVAVTRYGDDAHVDADDEGDGILSESRTIRQAFDNGDGTVTWVASCQQLPGKPKIKRRRRRQEEILLEGAVNSLGISTDDASARRVPTVEGHQAPASASAVGYSAFRQLHTDDNGNVVKKKGRPVGWRKALHSREALGLAPAKNKAPKADSPGVNKPLVEPQYQVWKCKWKDCPAELHNLETLRKHVVKVHGRPDEEGAWVCLWEGCKDESRGGDTTFEDVEGWLKHVDEQHLRPVAWRLGDGPRVPDFRSPSDSESAAYLSDAQGRSVTPVIQPPGLDSAVLEPTSRVLPHSLPRRKARGELDMLRKRKKDVGVVFGRTGSIWANKKRRERFLDDEDFEDEVETEDEHWRGDEEENEEAWNEHDERDVDGVS